MRIIVLPVGRCRFLEENESGLRFRRNKIWRLTECTTPYNRPSSVGGLNFSQDFMNEHCEIASVTESSKSRLYLLKFSLTELVLKRRNASPLIN